MALMPNLPFKADALKMSESKVLSSLWYATFSITAMALQWLMMLPALMNSLGFALNR